MTRPRIPDYVPIPGEGAFEPDEYRASVLGAESAEEPDRLLVEVDIADAMHARVPVPEFVVEPLIPRGTATLLGAHGGAGKSTLALTWCAHVAAGIRWAGLHVEHGNALFVSLEDPGPVVLYRLQKIVREYGIDWVELTGRLRVLDGTDVDAALMTEINDHGNRTLAATPIMAEVEQAAEGAQLIVVDNASDGFDANENDRRQVRQFVRRLAQIAKANGAGLVLLAHVDKVSAKFGSRGNTYSGSTAWHNSARSRLAMTEDEGSGLIVLAQEKLNLGRRADPLHLSWSDCGVLVPIEVDTEAQEQAAQQQADTDADAVLTVLLVAFSAEQTIPTAESGPYTAWHALQKLPELPEVYRDKPGRKRLESALVALERRKEIMREAYRKPNRHPGERWALAQKVRREAA